MTVAVEGCLGSIAEDCMAVAQGPLELSVEFYITRRVGSVKDWPAWYSCTNLERLWRHNSVILIQPARPTWSTWAIRTLVSVRRLLPGWSPCEQRHLPIENNQLAKGEVLAVARVRHSGGEAMLGFNPLCHPLALSKVQVEFSRLSDTQLEVRALCKLSGQTGVEMEALTAVSVAALTIYDMCKAMDKGMAIQDVRLLEKTGGKSGDWIREQELGEAQHKDGQG